MACLIDGWFDRWYSTRVRRIALGAVSLTACGPAAVSSGGDAGSMTSGPHDDGTAADTTPTADETGETPPDLDCVTTVESDLPGVAIDIVSDCTYSLGQAQAGVAAMYTVTIDEALPNVESGDDCDPTPAGGLHVDWYVRGDSVVHCRCDEGPCGIYEAMPTTLEPGTTMGGFSWAAYDWAGPSDTNVPYGAAFLPGEYSIEVVAKGMWLEEGAEDWVPFTVRATRPVVLVE